MAQRTRIDWQYRGDARSMARSPKWQGVLSHCLRKKWPHEKIEHRFPGLVGAMSNVVVIDYRKYPASMPPGWDAERYELLCRALRGEDVHVNDEGSPPPAPRNGGGDRGDVAPSSPPTYDADRSKWDEATWARAISDYDAAVAAGRGEGAAFLRAHGLSRTNIHYWRRKLSAEEAA